MKLVFNLFVQMFALFSSYFISIDADSTIPVADPEGGQGVRSNPPLELNYFIFMRNFRKSEAKLRKRTPSLNLNPQYRNPGSAPAFCLKHIFFVGPSTTIGEFFVPPLHVLLNKVEQLSVAMVGERVLSTGYSLSREKVRVDTPSVLPTSILQSV